MGMVPFCSGHPANCESCSFPCQPSDHIGIKECVARRPSSKAEDSGCHASSHAHTTTQRLRETDQVQTQNGPRATAPCPRSSYQHALSKYPEMREVAKKPMVSRQPMPPHCSSWSSCSHRSKPHVLARSLHLSCILLKTREGRCNALEGNC